MTCTCTTYHLCPVAAELWKYISKELWPKYHAAPRIYREAYYRATAAYLAHRSDNLAESQVAESAIEVEVKRDGDTA